MGAGCCSSKAKVLHKNQSYEWQEMLKSYKLESLVASSSKKLQDLVYQGIPNHLRWEVWSKLLQTTVVVGQYEELLKNSTFDSQIDKDIHRTFPSDEFVSSEQGQKGLKNLLSVLSSNLSQGYWQGMNYITAVVLIVSIGNEAESYFFLVNLFTKFEANKLFQADFSTLKMFCEKFHETLRKEDYALETFVKELSLEDNLWVFKWLITMFTYSFPLKTVIRLWDALLVRNLNFIVNICVSIAVILGPNIQGKSLESVLATLEKPEIDVEKILFKANLIKINW